jgi:cobalt/nickel transport system permease protein
VSGNHHLYVPGASPLHRLAPQCKLAATVLFVLAVVATPREAFGAFAAYAVILVGLTFVGHIPITFVLRRLVIEIPFLAFALLLPVVGQGERVEVLGMSLSVAGLWAMWNILVKGTLGVAATVIMAATTPVPAMLHGLEHLRLPKIFVGICAFMIRYVDVITGEMNRMRVARASRGSDPRWLWQARATAASAGTLFIRSYERGERVYLAMASRGYAGSMPLLDDHSAPAVQWAAAMCLPAIGALIAAVALVVT